MLFNPITAGLSVALALMIAFGVMTHEFYQMGYDARVAEEAREQLEKDASVVAANEQGAATLHANDAERELIGKDIEIHEVRVEVLTPYPVKGPVHTIRVGQSCPGDIKASDLAMINRINKGKAK